MGFIKKIVLTVMVGVGFASCKNESSPADNLLNRARNFYKTGDYAEAKKAIDSIAKVAPSALPQIDAGLYLLDSIRYSENFQIISEAEKLLGEVEQKLNSKQKLFVYDFDAKYQTSGTFIPKAHPLKTVNGLYAGVKANGELFLESVSSQAIRHNSVSVRVGDKVAQTAVVTDDGANYRYPSGGKQVEVVHYSANRILEVAALIAQNPNQRITVSLKGRSNVDFVLSANAQKGIADAFELAKLMEERESARFKIAKSKQLIKYLDSKRAKEIAARAASRLEKK